jgi:hypothetical protein
MCVGCECCHAATLRRLCANRTIFCLGTHDLLMRWEVPLRGRRRSPTPADTEEEDPGRNTAAVDTISVARRMTRCRLTDGRRLTSSQA